MEVEPTGVRRRTKDASWDFVLSWWMYGDAISVMKNIWRGCLLDFQVGITNLELDIYLNKKIKYKIICMYH